MPSQERMHVRNLIKSMKWIKKAYINLIFEKWGISESGVMVYPKRTGD